MIFGPLLVKRHLAKACIKAFPHDAAVGLVFVSRTVRGVRIPLDGHIAYKASCSASTHTRDVLRYEPTIF